MPLISNRVTWRRPEAPRRASTPSHTRVTVSNWRSQGQHQHAADLPSMKALCGSPFRNRVSSDRGSDMPTTASTTTARTLFLRGKRETYAYRRFGGGAAPPLLFLQHFMGTLDNYDPAVVDPLASERELILFDNAGIGRSTGKVPDTVQGMA